MLRSVLIGILCLAAGLAVGYFAAYGQIDESRHMLANMDEADSTRPEVANPFTSTQIKPLATAARDSEETPAAVSQMKRGTGVITGSIVDAEGHAIAGVRLKAVRANQFDPRNLERPGMVADGVLSPEELLQKHQAALLRDPSREAVASSNDKGEFSLEGLDKAPYNLEAHLAGYELSPLEEGNAFFGRWPGDKIAIRAVRMGGVVVNILLPDGNAPAVAELTCTRNDSTSSFQWNAAESFIPLAAGHWQLVARGGEMGELRSEKVTAVVGVSGSSAAVELKLEDRPHVRGKLLFEAAPPDQSFTVLLWKEDQDPATTNRWEATNWTEHARTLATQGFLFMDLVPGLYRLAVGWEDEEHPPVLATVTVAEHGVVQDLQMRDAVAGPEWEVVVLDPEGKPIVDANIETSFWMGNNSAWRRGADGTQRGRVPKHIRDGKNEEQLFAWITTGAFGKSSVELPRNGGRVESRMQPVGVLKVRFLASSETQRKTLSAGLQMHAPNGQPQLWVGNQEAGTKGEASFAPLQPGTYSISLSVPTGGWNGNQNVSSRVLQINSGENSLDLGMPLLFNFKVHVKAAEPLKQGGHLRLQAEGNGSEGVNYNSNAPVGTDGVAKFENVPAGRYQLHIWMLGRSMMKSITVPVEGDVVMDLEAFRAMRVMIHNKDAEITKSGFANEDIIIGANGREFATPTELANAMRFMSGTEEVPVMVLRSGKVETLNLPGRVFAESNGFNWNFVQR